MVELLLKKSWKDVSGKRTRMFFSVMTIALGVLGIALFAVNPLADRLIEEEVDRENVHHLRISIEDSVMDRDTMADLRSLQNVESAEPRILLYTKAYDGERRIDAMIVGIENPGMQVVDKVIFEGGAVPGINGIFAEKSNAPNGVHDSEKGDLLRIIDHTGSEDTRIIEGFGRSIVYSGGSLVDDPLAVFYTSAEMVRDIGNLSGWNSLSFRLHSTADKDIEETLSGIRMILEDQGHELTGLPDVRTGGDWPLMGVLDNIVTIMYVLTFLAILCSVFLIWNTMNTLVSEQRKWISVMRALGASKLQVAVSVLVSAAVLGLIGGIIGTVLGIFLPYLIIDQMAGMFGLVPGFMVEWKMVAISGGAGLLISLISSLPALILALRIPVREGFDDHGITSTFGKGPMERLFGKMKVLPSDLRMGIRNIFRKKGRTTATVFQIALAVGVFVGLSTFSHSLGVAISDSIEEMTWDIKVQSIDEGSVSINQSISMELEDINGIDTVEPFIRTFFKIGDNEVRASGYMHDGSGKDHESTLEKGRWFTKEDEDNLSMVVVLASTIAKIKGVDVGDHISVETSTGAHELEVIGIDSSWFFMGMAIYLPLRTIQNILDVQGRVSGFHIFTSTDDHDVIDGLSVDAEDLLISKGHPVDTEIFYVIKERNLGQNQDIIDMVMMVSIIIVLISMIGLVNGLVMNIMERTREVGIMRCIGSTSRKIRIVFGSEIGALSLVGWGIGIPIGILIAASINEMMISMMDFDVGVHVPGSVILLSLVLTVAGTLLIIQGPLFRAVRMRPGDALRYQ